MRKFLLSEVFWWKLNNKITETPLIFLAKLLSSIKRFSIKVKAQNAEIGKTRNIYVFIFWIICYIMLQICTSKFRTFPFFSEHLKTRTHRRRFSTPQLICIEIILVPRESSDTIFPPATQEAE